MHGLRRVKHAPEAHDLVCCEGEREARAGRIEEGVFRLGAVRPPKRGNLIRHAP